MRNTRFLGTTAYTLYDNEGREYIFVYDGEEFVNEFDDFLRFVEINPDTRNNDFGVEFTDLDGNDVFVSFDDMKNEYE